MSVRDSREAGEGGEAFRRLCGRIESAMGPAAGRIRHLVAVSGGVDSMVLLAALRTGLGWKRLVVVHVNHGLRGRASGADAAFVRREAARMGLETEVVKVDARKLARAERISLEAAARKARYAALAGVARRRRCARVILAHHADDQVETVLMNFFRGTGGRGLGGMRRRVERLVEGARLELDRPLLGVWREEIDAAAREEGIQFREDASNLSRDFLRNRIRQDLLPEIRRCFGRDVRHAVLRAAQQAKEETGFFDELALDDVGSAELSVKRLRAMHPALVNRVLRGWLEARGVPDIGYKLVESVRALLPEGAATASVNVPGGRVVRRKGGKLFVQTPEQRRGKR